MCGIMGVVQDHVARVRSRFEFQISGFNNHQHVCWMLSRIFPPKHAAPQISGLSTDLHIGALDVVQDLGLADVDMSKNAADG